MNWLAFSVFHHMFRLPRSNYWQITWAWYTFCSLKMIYNYCIFLGIINLFGRDMSHDFNTLTKLSYVGLPFPQYHDLIRFAEWRHLKVQCRLFICDSVNPCFRTYCILQNKYNLEEGDLYWCLPARFFSVPYIHHIW